MKTIAINKVMLPAVKRATGCCIMMLAALLPMAQETQQLVRGFTIIGRQPVPVDRVAGIPAPAGGDVISIKGESDSGKLLYRITGHDMQAVVPALTNVEVAKGGGRIWVYGDTVYNHAATNLYAHVYAANGSVIKSLGLLGKQPYTAAVADNGSMAFVGNISKEGQPAFVLSLFDANGNKRWSANLPVALPSKVFVADDHQFTAVSLFFPQEYATRVLVFDNTGKLLYVHKGDASGIAFLPAKKMVISAGRYWSMYDMANDFKIVHAGVLPGVTVGRRPVVVHPAANAFLILSISASDGRISLQAYDARTGSMLAQSAFEGKGYQQPYRQLETLQDGSIRLRTEEEIISVSLN